MAEWLISKWVSPYTSEWYRLITIFGVVNIVLTVLALALFTLRRINRHGFGNKNATLKTIITPLRKMHPIIGILLLVSAYIHGDLAFDGDWLFGSMLRVHTGPLTWWIVLAMLLVATLGKTWKMKHWVKAHRGLAVALLAAVAVHLFARNLLG